MSYDIFIPLINKICIMRDTFIDIEELIDVPAEYAHYEFVEFVYYNMLCILYGDDQLNGHIVSKTHEKCICEFGTEVIKPIIPYLDIWDCKHKKYPDLTYNPTLVKCISSITSKKLITK